MSIERISKHLPWLWGLEFGSIERISRQLKKDKFLQGDVVKSILTECISTSDAIVTFYKNRAGSSFPAYSGMPFEATFHEIQLAIQYQIPILIIFIGNKPSSHLADTLAILDHPEIISMRFYAKDDDEALNIALYQLKHYFSVSHQESISEFDLDNLVKVNDELNNAIMNQNYNKGVELATINRHFADQVALNRDQQYHQAQFFSKMGTIYANRRMFPDSIAYLYKSIYLYMKLGYDWSMTAEIQGLSGVQNMANLPVGQNTNAFGFRATRIFKDLANGFRDARISMYRNQGRFSEAWKLIDLKSYVHSPYRASKMLSIYAGRNRYGVLDFARQMMEFEVLPWAIENGSSLDYVYMEAGNLAFKQNDYVSAEGYYNSAMELALSKGALHTVSRVRLMLSNVYKKKERRT